MLLGGSQSDVSRTFTHGFFHDGVKSTQFKASGQYFLRVLPAFDPDKQGTPDYETSYLSYRSAELPEDWKTKTPGFTSWYFIIQGYTFYGKGNVSLVSPLSGVHGQQSKRGVDPIFDIRDFAIKSDDVQIRALTEDKSYKERAAAPTPRYFVLTNVYLMTDVNSRKTENQIGIFTNAAWTDLKSKLALRAGRNDEVISKEWEDYLYGDITHPKEGLAATVRETQAESNDKIRFAGLHFSDSAGRLDGNQKWDISDTDALRDRYVISDDENVTRVWSYDEILDYVVQDGIIPYNIIEQACAPHAANGIPTPVAPARNADYSIPSQIEKEEVVEDEIPAGNTIGTDTAAFPTPTAEKVAETTPVPKIQVPVNTADSNKESTSTEVSDSDRARYDELSTKFKENPNNLKHEELPEFFDLCAKLGVSPSS